MTKVSVWDKKKKGNEKPIEFVELVKQGSSPTTDCPCPSNWDKIMLLCKNYKDSGFDLMFAYDNDGKNECLFFGHFNSGKVWV
jgi:hypothetical protein